MVRAKYWVKAQEFSGQPKSEDFKLVEEELPELKNGGTTFFTGASELFVGKSFIWFPDMSPVRVQ